MTKTYLAIAESYLLFKGGEPHDNLSHRPCRSDAKNVLHSNSVHLLPYLAIRKKKKNQRLKCGKKVFHKKKIKKKSLKKNNR